MAVNDVFSLPHHILNMNEMKELLSAEQNEIQRIEELIKHMEKQLNINSCDHTLNRYEKIFNIEPIINDNESRRRSIISKLNTRTPSTVSTIKSMVELLSEKDIELEEVYNDYCFIIGVIQSDLHIDKVPSIRKYLDEAKPAHLAYNLRMVRKDKKTIYTGIGFSNAEILTFRERGT